MCKIATIYGTGVMLHWAGSMKCCRKWPFSRIESPFWGVPGGPKWATLAQSMSWGPFCNNQKTKQVSADYFAFPLTFVILWLQDLNERHCCFDGILDIFSYLHLLNLTVCKVIVLNRGRGSKESFHDVVRDGFPKRGDPIVSTIHYTAQLRTPRIIGKIPNGGIEPGKLWLCTL